MFEIELFIKNLVSTISLGAITIFLAYWYTTKNHDYWKKRGVPYVKPIPIFGSSFDTFTQSKHEIQKARQEKFGPIYGYFEGDKPYIVIACPKLIRDILVKDFAFFPDRREARTKHKVTEHVLQYLKIEDWKRVRAIISPAYTTSKLKRMQDLFKECAGSAVQNFKTEGENGKSFDVKRIYDAFSIDVIASTTFSRKIDSHNNPDNELVKTAETGFMRKMNWKRLIVLVVPGFACVLKKLGFNIFQSEPLDYVESFILQLIEERKRTGQVSNDFLQFMLDIEKVPVKEENDKENIASNNGQINGHNMPRYISTKTLSMDELVSQCVVFFLAAYSTTSTVLSHATYLLALHQDIQDKLRAEVEETLERYNGELTYDAIQEMKFLNNVVSESMRLFPPATKLDRLTGADYKLGDTGITIPKGTVVEIPVFALHRNHEYYPDPDRFDPDRFNPEESSKRDPFCYLPFGGGPRLCIGRRLAMMEIKFCLAHVLSNFIIKRSPKTKVPLDYAKNSFSLMQPKEMVLEKEPRTDSILIT